jgi:hypothetical protein
VVTPRDADDGRPDRFHNMDYGPRVCIQEFEVVSFSRPSFHTAGRLACLSLSIDQAKGSLSVIMHRPNLSTFKAFVSPAQSYLVSMHLDKVNPQSDDKKIDTLLAIR